MIHNKHIHLHLPSHPLGQAYRYQAALLLPINDINMIKKPLKLDEMILKNNTERIYFTGVQDS